MHKILRHPGHIVVDDVRHVVHMQAARRDVRGNTITAGLLTRLFAPTILAIRLFDAHSVVWKERGRNQMQRDRKQSSALSANKTIAIRKEFLISSNSSTLT